EITVQQAPAGSNWDFTATVTLGDGTKYELRLHKPFTTQINGVPNNIHFVDSKGKTTEPTVTTDKDGNEQMVLPSDFVDGFTVNGDASTATDSTTNSNDNGNSGKSGDSGKTGKTDKEKQADKSIDDEVAALAKATGKSDSQVRQMIFDVYYSDL